MRPVRLVLIGCFALGVILQAPLSASAQEPVPTIELPPGTWDVTATVVSKDAANLLEFGLSSPQDVQVCPQGAAPDCAPGDEETIEDLSGELVFYLTDVTCSFESDVTFLSTDPESAEITQTDDTHWTIGWDDAGTCASRDGDFDDLIVSVIAHGPPTDHAQTFYDGTEQVTLETARDTAGGFYSRLIVPPGLQPGVVTIDEFPADEPIPGFPGINPATFCGGRPCEFQFQVTALPQGTTSANNPIQVFWFYTDGTGGNKLYVKGDAEAGSSEIKPCSTPNIANPPKCRSSIIRLPNKDRQYLMLWRNGGDPVGAKRG
jgi:hypothetical protein